MRQSHLIISNAAIMWTSRVLLLVPQLILVPYLISTIGDSGYGVYALVWSLMMSIEQLQRSLQSGVIKYTAGFLAQKRVKEVNQVVSSSFVYSLILAIVACASILVAATFYNEPSGQVGSALIVISIMVLFIIPLTPYVAVIQSRQRYYVGAISETISKYLSLFIVMAWFHTVGPSVEALIIIMAVMLFLSKLAQTPIAYRLVPGLRIQPGLFDKGSFKMIASFGMAIVLASLCIVVNTTGVRWIMSTLVSTSFVAHLTIMLLPSILLSQVINAVTITVMPASSAYNATGNLKMLKELLIRGSRYTTILVLAGLMVTWLLIREVLLAWVGSDYAFLAPYAFVLFASTSFMLSTSTAHHMLKGLKKLRTIVAIYLIGLVIVPILTILLIFVISDNPYIAVTSGLAFGHLVCGTLQMKYCLNAVTTDKLQHSLTHIYGQPLIVAAVSYSLIYVITVSSGLDGLFVRIGISFVAVTLFFFACYIFIASKTERQQLNDFIHMSLCKISATSKKTLVL